MLQQKCSVPSTISIYTALAKGGVWRMILEALGSAMVPRSKDGLVTMENSLGFLPPLRSSRGFPLTGLRVQRSSVGGEASRGH